VNWDISVSALPGVLVGTGAMAGTLSRYLVGRWCSRVAKSSFPWGTWAVNMLGALLVGVCFRELVATFHDANGWWFLGGGFCGGFTTFSTMSTEVLTLMRKRPVTAAAYLLSSLVVGCMFTWIAISLP
jgi:CrcB protein